MKTNRLSEKLSTALNEQMTKEAHASQIYLSYASWADSNGYSGIANFLFRHGAEERNHMMKLLEYILKRGAKVKVTAIPAPTSDPVSVNNCFEKVFEHEVSNTKSIYKLAKLSHNEEDWATWNLLQWFVKEQTEEENLAISLLDKIKIAGGEKATSNALYLLDKELGETPNDARLAQEVTTDNP
ncbi:MAG: ferritin [Ulvibacter sp.]|jgi:ferritin